MPKTELAKRVGREVRSRMVLTETSQAELAAILGLSQSAISRRLIGEVPFDATELIRIAPRLGVLPSTLMALDDREAVA